MRYETGGTGRRSPAVYHVPVGTVRTVPSGMIIDMAICSVNGNPTSIVEIMCVMLLTIMYRDKLLVWISKYYEELA